MAAQGDSGLPRRVGVYAGTFDPVTKGHIDIIRRALRLVDLLHVGVAISRDKKPVFPSEERVEILKEALAETGIEAVVSTFDGLLTHFAESVGAIIVVRGLRAVSDFEYEFQMVGMNRALDRAIETVFLMSDPEYQAISSRLVKEIASLGGDARPFVPRTVVPHLQARLGMK